MDRILIILKNENCPRVSSTPALELTTTILNMFIGIYSRSQASVYRTIGPPVYGFNYELVCLLTLCIFHLF